MAKTSESQRTPDALPDWGGPAVPARVRFPMVPLAVITVLSLGLGLLVNPIVGVAGALVSLVLGVIAVSIVPRRLLRRQRAERARLGDEPRLHNLVRGISQDLGIGCPEVWVAPGSPNAVALHLARPIVCVRRELLETFTRTELEATVSFLLVGLVTGVARTHTIPRWASPRRAAPDLATLDVYAASVTRYPPGLAAALQRCSPAREPGLWLVGDDNVEGRAAALLDL